MEQQPEVGGYLTNTASGAVEETDLMSEPSHALLYSSFKDGELPKVRLDEEEQRNMSRSIIGLFELEEEPEKEDEVMREGDEDVEDVVDVADRARRTERLKKALPMLAHLWWQDSLFIDEAAEKLADGARDYENRERVVSANYMPTIISQLQNDTLLAFVIPVLYNVCVDYVPAQQAASKSHLSTELTTLISSPRFKGSMHFLGYICKIYEMLIQQPSEPDLAPENTPIVLLNLAADRENPVDMEDYMALVNAAAGYLGHERFQKALIKTPLALDTTLTILVDSYTRFDSHPSIGPETTSEDDAKLLTRMRINLNQALSDISALPEFKEACPIVSPFASSLRRWLSSPQIQLQVCACIMLGNLARNDEACETFVHTARVHQPLVAILQDANDSQLLHAALGFLKNLALPLKNKEVLGASGLFDVLPRLWLLDILQPIQLSSISLTRQLLNGWMDNVHRICQRLTPDTDSPAHDRSKLSLLIALFDRTDVEPIRMEIARLITAVCRVFTAWKGLPQEELNDMRARFLQRHPDLGRPLSFMVSQTKWPIVRSEGWFTFAIMARYSDSAQCISDMMQDVSVFQPLVELLTGKPLLEYQASSSTSPAATETSPLGSTSQNQTPTPDTNPFGLDAEPQSPEPVMPEAQAAEMARIDRENALVLVSELLKNRGSEMAVMRRTLFEDLLKGGGELVMSYREAKAENGQGVWKEDVKHRANLNFSGILEESVEELS
ncbi:GTP binding protein [Rutstroemia sp. NJR-2017a WRK4]|nr:GTP binding protein [Rutstroemia sp. NJR-2017a WRK4]